MSIANISARIRDLQTELERLEAATQGLEMGNAPERAPSKARRTCRPLARRKVGAQISRLPAHEKGIAMQRFMCRRRRRHGSDAFGRAHPQDAVNDGDKLLMRDLHRQGISFRALEEIFHLIPNSGNSARRCVLMGDTLFRRQVAQNVARCRALARATRTS